MNLSSNICKTKFCLIDWHDSKLEKRAELIRLMEAGGSGLFEGTDLQLALSNYGRAIERHKER